MNIEKFEAALCLWEAFLESPESYPELFALREQVGVASLRLEFAKEEILEACHKGWEAVSNGGLDYGEPFDWEFCPRFLSCCVTVSDQSVVLVDNLGEQLLVIAATAQAA